MNDARKGLWTRDFSCITGSTILSAIGGEAMNLPISLLVFEETQSTFLSAMIMICGILPDVLLSVPVAPLIDKGNKKKWIVGLDLLMMFIYVFMGFWIAGHKFSFMLYLLFTLGTGTISVFYRLAYQAWYPSLIPKGLEQKGYAVSGTVYPLVVIVMSPVATFLYETISMSQLFFIVAGLTIVSVVMEAAIKEGKVHSESYSFAQYKRDIKEGFHYLKKEKGIRNIYTYMSITQGTSEGMNVILQAYYQTQPALTVTMLGFLKSAEMLGRVLGGAVQYHIEIPLKRRYGLTRFVYIFYQLADMVLLFTPYPLMVVNRFVCGGLGVTSATIRETAVQSYLPEGMRARVSALFQMIFALGGILFQLFAGGLGQILPYRLVIVLMGVISLISVVRFIVIPEKENRPVYEAVRE